MANYDFSTLNDRDLEELTRDLLSKKLNVNFQSFKPGPDKGIDLRYSTINDENEIVVQVKHYLSSGISKLKQDLKNNEISKLASLNPKHYIFCTSLPLSPQDKQDIKSAVFPRFFCYKLYQNVKMQTIRYLQNLSTFSCFDNCKQL